MSSLTQELHGTDAGVGAASAGEISFVPVSLDTLIDSPLYAASHMRQFALDPEALQPIRLTLFGDRPQRTEMTSEQLAWQRALVHEADAVFGSRPFAHYDLIVTLSAPFGIDGLEHRQSSEVFLHPDSFTDWQTTWDSRYLLAHEFVHAWNGKWRMPAGLHSADLNTDLSTDLLWVYEGQTQYWAKVLSTRSGIWNQQQMHDDLAVVAAQYVNLPARTWRPLLDSTLDPVINPREETEWRSWQRFQDYYDEGSLVCPACTAESARHGLHCFASSVGLTVDGDGIIESVEWNGVAFRAGLSAGMKLISVNGFAFSPEALLSAIVAAQTSPEPIDIVAADQDHVDLLHLPYHGGPRYPHLVRTSGTTDWLDASVQPRNRGPAGPNSERKTQARRSRPNVPPAPRPRIQRTSRVEASSLTVPRDHSARTRVRGKSPNSARMSR